MKKLVLLVALCALIGGGWTWTHPHAAQAAPTTCHGHNSACTAAAGATPSATIAVTTLQTIVDATGCQPGEFVSYHVEYDSAFSTSTFNAELYSNADANGSFDHAYNVGSDLASGFIGAPYTSAHMIFTCGELVMVANTTTAVSTNATDGVIIDASRPTGADSDGLWPYRPKCLIHDDGTVTCG